MITTATYTGTFPGAPDQVGRVRAELRRYLGDCPRADDAVLIASELAANAILHSASAGEVFTVRAEVFPSYVWVEVEDLGGPWLVRQRDERPHGLDLVTALAGGNWGTRVTSGGCRSTWARVSFRG